MTLTLPPDLEQRVAEEAGRQGIAADDYLLQAIQEKIEQDRRAEAIAALRSFREGDPEEQRETFEALKRGLNETRTENGERLIFP